MVMWFLILFIAVIVIAVLVDKEEKENLKHNEGIIASLENFTPTKTIKNSLVDTHVYIDGTREKISFAFGMKKAGFDMHTFQFNELLECSILEDGATVQSGGVGRAVVGGVLAGGVGAVVGATTRKSTAVTRNLSVRVVTSKLNSPLLTIPIITAETKRNSLEYREKMDFAQRVYATITSIIYKNQSKS